MSSPPYEFPLTDLTPTDCCFHYMYLIATRNWIAEQHTCGRPLKNRPSYLLPYWARSSTKGTAKGTGPAVPCYFCTLDRKGCCRIPQRYLPAWDRCFHLLVRLRSSPPHGNVEHVQDIPSDGLTDEWMDARKALEDVVVQVPENARSTRTRFNPFSVSLHAEALRAQLRKEYPDDTGSTPGSAKLSHSEPRDGMPSTATEVTTPSPGPEPTSGLVAAALRVTNVTKRARPTSLCSITNVGPAKRRPSAAGLAPGTGTIFSSVVVRRG